MSKENGMEKSHVRDFIVKKIFYFLVAWLAIGIHSIIR